MPIEAMIWKSSEKWVVEIKYAGGQFVLKMFADKKAALEFLIAGMK